MEYHDLLFEILTEELPPKRLSLLEKTLASSIQKQLIAAELSFAGITSYATPRRLAILIKQLADQQAAQKVEFKGPSVAIAFDSQQQLTPAGLGFLKKYNITKEQVSIIESDKGACLYFAGENPGASIDNLMPDIIKNALKDLPIPKPMRWGNHRFSFIRPVHSIILLYGERVLSSEFFGIQAHRTSLGHRQLSHEPIDIGFPANYASQLEEQGCVIAESSVRRSIILDQIDSTLQALSEIVQRGELKIAITDSEEYENLLEEVTSLVEWPKVLLCRFEESFLNIPKEALMASMQGHQKCFGIMDTNKTLLPYFITVSNLQSIDETAIIHGNERVMRARLSDAKFFYETDLKIPLETYLPKLEKTIYQEKLGTLADKVERITKLACELASCRGYWQSPSSEDDIVASITRAAELCKLDLFSHMVGEFPELQGIMGKYYALHEGESADVADAIEEHYWPRFSEDKIPTKPISVALALADRLDTIIEFFKLGFIPTGDKDPFGLKRAALGVLKIMIHHQLNIRLQDILNTTELANFFKERFKSLALERGISTSTYHAFVNSLEQLHQPADTLNRLHAIEQFLSHASAKALIQGNKRVANLLKKEVANGETFSIDPQWFEQTIEKSLHEHIVMTQKTMQPLLEAANYAAALSELATLKPLIDQFLEDIKVNVEDKNLRNNRLGLIQALRKLFLHIADFSELS